MLRADSLRDPGLILRILPTGCPARSPPLGFPRGLYALRSEVFLPFLVLTFFCLLSVFLKRVSRSLGGLSPLVFWAIAGMEITSSSAERNTHFVNDFHIRVITPGNLKLYVLKQAKLIKIQVTPLCDF